MSKRKKEKEAVERIAATEREVERLVGEKRYDEARARIDAVSEPSVRLRQLRGLALARLGRAREARKIFAGLRDEGHVDGETLGMLGRTYMDWYDRTGRVALLRRSRDLYAEGFDLEPTKSYCGINAAAKSVLLGDEAAAERFLEGVTKALARERADLEDAGRAVDYWWLATSAEAMLLRGAVAEAAVEYRRAVRLAPRDLGSHGTTWLQAKRILNVRGASPEQRALVANVFRDLVDADPALEVTRPPTRRIRAFALDPAASRTRATVGLNEVTLQVPWEADAAGRSTLSPGPVGEYVEVIDHDPANRSE
ncbi:MAG: tetratricopeptide repeat-containing protein, partial [Planctomycetota bacterium JB042]